MGFLAHISINNNSRREQTNKQHLIETGELARKTLEDIGLGTTGYLAGLLHDMGKHKKAFNEYLEKIYRGEAVSKGSVNHTFAGVIYILEEFHGEDKDYYQNVTSEIIAYAIASHHGIIDCLNVDGVFGLQHRLDCKANIEYEETIINYFNEVVPKEDIENLFNASVGEITNFINNIVETWKTIPNLDTMIGFIARLVLASVVNGDRISTAEFMEEACLRNGQATRKLWIEELFYMEEELRKLQSNTPINRARSQISKLCKEAAYLPHGIYRLSLPTGAGKTFASLRYALTHAEKYEKKRIIFVIPLLTILEQNSQEIKKKIKNQSVILEHHSNVIQEIIVKESLDEYELLSSNWDSPIIITTLVQLLNTLFSSKITCVRRMQALVNSIIVIDEVQSLPGKTINMFNMAMNFLHECCNCTVILSSATQPCLDESENKLVLKPNADIVPYDRELFSPFKRTNVHNAVTQYGMTIEDLTVFSYNLLEEKSSLLVICNTKSSALKLYKRLKLFMDGDDTVYELVHLSASMCPQHRRDVLHKMKENLSRPAEKKVICIATQIVEAGVDISFESVIRLVAGLDNLAQAVGRCNRSNEYGYLCDVYLINLKADEENFRFLKEIEYAQRSTLKFIYAFRNSPEVYHNDLLSDESILTYYRNYYRMPEVKKLQKYPVMLGGVEHRLYNMLSSNELVPGSDDNSYLLKQAFKTAGELFEVFDVSTTDIIVPYNVEAEDIITDLCSEKASFDLEYLRGRVNKAKQYTIHIYEYQKRQLEDMGMLYSDKERRFITLKTRQCYDPVVGLIIENNYVL